MRSIGKKNKNLVIRLTQEVIKKDPYSYVLEEVRKILPLELWDTWESADSEINNIIMDTIFTHRRNIC